MILAVSILMLLQSYFGIYPKEAEAVASFYTAHPEVYQELVQKLTPEEAGLAMCIVAPEVSQYSRLSDSAETGMLKLLYVQRGLSDFSVGLFQMKPSFIENLEKEVLQDEELLRLFPDVPVKQETERKNRSERIKRLSLLDWQV